MDGTITYAEFSRNIGVTAEHLVGFFEGWPEQPSSEALLDVLNGSYRSFVARADGDRVVGIATAISDGVLSASIPLLEVLPEFQGRGIGSRLMELMLSRLDGLYMIDLSCDVDLVPFYRRLGMDEVGGMGIRHRDVLPTL